MRAVVSRSAPVADADTLAAILDELRAIHCTLAAGRPSALPDDAVRDLLRAIVANVGDHAFCCSDLLTRIPSPADVDLRAAIRAACGVESARRIGKLLKVNEGRDVFGLRIVRVGQERDGITWQVVASLRV